MWGSASAKCSYLYGQNMIEIRGSAAIDNIAADWDIQGCVLEVRRLGGTRAWRKDVRFGSQVRKRNAVFLQPVDKPSAGIGHLTDNAW